MKHRVVIRASAYDDLLHIIDYLAERSPAAALRFRAACLQLADSLPDMPYRGPAEPADPSSRLRRVIVPAFDRYLMYYFVFEEKIVIIRILHTSRDLPAELEQSDDIS
ncbi:MAG: type II toxin-antitoxin system RelE/ParE family toxin [Tepidisphaeraceae bacterium]